MTDSTDIPICGLPEPDGPCRKAAFRMPDGTLARRCEGHLGLDEPDEDAAFAGQRPEPSAASQARNAMIEIIAGSIEHLVSRGVLALPDDVGASKLAPRRAASVIIDDLAADILTKTLQGMAVGSVQAGLATSSR